MPPARPADPSRRRLLAGAAAAALLPALGPLTATPAGAADPADILRRPIPSTGEEIPVVGMGTWITFNVGDSEPLRQDRLEVLRTFLALGGGMVDSSPMYGTAEEVVGWCLERLPAAETAGLFSATKVWTTWLMRDGPQQMAESRRLWGLDRFDLMQVHNLEDWEDHLPTLADDKAAGRVRYVGVTTSHGRRHDEMARIMERHPLDFIQITYNILDREVEDHLLPLAAERGIAVIVNRPFRQGNLFRTVAGRPLPGWAAEIGATSWAQVMLSFIVSHPAVTCVIPATTRVDHMRENMAVLRQPLPDAALRRRMADDLRVL